MAWRNRIKRMPVEVDLYDMQDLWEGALEICTSVAVPKLVLALYL